MKKLTLFLLLLLPALSQASAPLDYCDRQLGYEIKSIYNIQDLHLYRGYLREILNYSHEALQGYVDANDGSIPVPLPIAKDILQAEKADAETKRLLDELRARYSSSPDLSLGSRDFEVFASRVLAPDTVAKWDRCKITCKECRANVGNKQNGVAYRILGQENETFAVTFTYLPERATDPVAVVVTGVTVIKGAAQEPTILERGAIFHRYTDYTQTFQRADPEEDVAIKIDLEDRPGLEILVTDSESDDASPVGTIVASMLRWEKFAEVAGDKVIVIDGKQTFDPKHHRWAPCDGRDIAGSELAKHIPANNTPGSLPYTAPDLRGVFLRGLNRFAEDNPEFIFPEQKDPGEKQNDGSLVVRTEAGILQGDNVGAHEHTFKGEGAKGMANADHDKDDIDKAWYGGEDYQQEKERRTIKGPTGETRPRNVAVHYYIRINE
uniref:Phage Tail Collar Domain n=1 Tax=Candidatus Kentrum sp. TUN TaxID=2126343 RepID=A0A450ZBN5_9GAMM|nr:MAG: hypothetical protein BECKTUN1418E_GA0071001_100539 [Candidatus Kentron sp. TUN]VFK57473.1 MAG: hypothetical protein BECKTUN1418F_GA0071002_11175 [Candidatus Kentron sp. TUN]